MENTCAFTGHRPQSLLWKFNENDERCIKVKEKLEHLIRGLIEKYGVTHFISGMAQGIDLYAAEIVIKLKEEYPVLLECAIPCDTQTNGWSLPEVSRYEKILSLADKVTYVSHQYTKECMMKRNKYMVDNALYLIAVWNGQGSGTGNTVRYAKGKDRKIIIIDPNNMKQYQAGF